MKNLFIKLSKYLFILLFFSALLLFEINMIFYEQIDINFINNRNAYKVPKFSWDTFFDGTYQSDLELAVADQLYGSEELTQKGLQLDNELFALLKPLYNHDSYHLVGRGYYQYQDYPYLVVLPRSDNFFDNNGDAFFKFIAQDYEKVTLKEKYMYLVSSDYSVNFDNPSDNYVKTVASFYPSYEYDYLKINGIDDYIKYYNRCDHHWNYIGAHQGYIDIINMLFDGKEKTLEPIEEIELPFYYKGSRSLETQLPEYEDKMRVYRYDIPEYDLYVDGVLGKNDNRTLLLVYPDYFDDDYKVHYNDYYGWNRGELIYDFHAPEKENLLVVGLSDKMAVIEVLSSHFNKTYALDPRYYGEIDLNAYIIERDIDKILLIANADGFGWPDFKLNVKE